MRIAVIGASGFVGLRICELLKRREDCEILPVVRAVSSLAVLAREQYPQGWRVTSFLDAQGLAKSISGCDACIHVAIGDAAQIPMMANSIYQACKIAKVPRLVWMSSASVHGQNPPPETTEASTLHDKHPLIYNNAKVRAEWILEKLAKGGEVEVVRLRPSVVYGPRSRWIYDVANQLLASKATWLQNGEGVCNGVYVDNLVEAAYLSCVAQGVGGSAFLIGDAETITWRDFLLPIADHFGLGASDIRSIANPEFTAERESRLAALTLTPAYGAIARSIPDRPKRLLKGLFKAWPNPRPNPSAYALQAGDFGMITHEMALLQQCEWGLSSALARQHLGYVPVKSFKEGMDASLDWLDYIALSDSDI